MALETQEQVSRNEIRSLGQTVDALRAASAAEKEQHDELLVSLHRVIEDLRHRQPLGTTLEVFQIEIEGQVRPGSKINPSGALESSSLLSEDSEELGSPARIGLSFLEEASPGFQLSKQITLPARRGMLDSKGRLSPTLSKALKNVAHLLPKETHVPRSSLNPATGPNRLSDSHKRPSYSPANKTSENRSGSFKTKRQKTMFTSSKDLNALQPVKTGGTAFVSKAITSVKSSRPSTSHRNALMAH